MFPFAGFLAHQGVFSLPVILLLNTVGALTGSALSYWVGIKGGKPFLVRYGKYFFVNAADIEKTERFFEKYGARAILIGRFVPVKLVQFGAIGVLGVGVHLALLYLTLNVFGAAFAMAQATAVVGAMTFNFALNNRFTYRDRQLKGARWFKGLISFYLVCSLGAVANVGIGSLVYERVHGWAIAGVAGAIVGSVWNYVASGWLTWTKR